MNCEIVNKSVSIVTPEIGEFWRYKESPIIYLRVLLRIKILNDCATAHCYDEKYFYSLNTHTNEIIRSSIVDSNREILVQKESLKLGYE